MSAEASTSIGGVWARLEGQVVDGLFPLRRLLGSSEHSGVFLTEAAKLAPEEVALKLVSIASARAESQLARWYAAAGGVSHPHLVRLFDVGRCNVAGLGNLYALMEYADQDLAQLLQRRALTEDEAREMLVPTLSALAFLHERRLVLGRMKPSNVLVVGDQLKLASDAIRPVGEVDDVKALSAYDSPEARDGTCSTASDVWALGVTLCEALTRRQPLGLLGAGAVVLPPDLPPAFREIVAWCLRRQPQDRPEVAEIDAWLSGKPVAVVTTQSKPATELPAPPATARPPVVEPPRASASASPAASLSAATVDVELAAGLESVAAPKVAPAAHATAPAVSKAAPVVQTIAPAAPTAGKPASVSVPGAKNALAKSKPVEPSPRPASRAEIDAGDSAPPPRRSLVLLAVGLIVVIAVVWAGIRVFGTKSAAPPVAEASNESRPEASVAEQAPASVAERAPPIPSERSALAARSQSTAADVSSAGIQEVVPDVPPRARRTIRGHVRVAVRVIVEQDGTVFAALAEQRGPSRYFERHAIDAAKKWTFPPSDESAQRLMLVKFDFTRDGTTAQAVPLK